MNMIDIGILLAVAAVIGFVIRYICRAKKKGVRCIGCPHAAACGGACACHGVDSKQ